jgi:hypothetical protein
MIPVQRLYQLHANGSGSGLWLAVLWQCSGCSTRVFTLGSKASGQHQQPPLLSCIEAPNSLVAATLRIRLVYLCTLSGDALLTHQCVYTCGMAAVARCVHLWCCSHPQLVYKCAELHLCAAPCTQHPADYICGTCRQVRLARHLSLTTQHAGQADLRRVHLR